MFECMPCVWRLSPLHARVSSEVSLTVGYSPAAKAHMWTNCALCGKSMKLPTVVIYTLKIILRLGPILDLTHFRGGATF